MPFVRGSWMRGVAVSALAVAALGDSPMEAS